MNEDLPIRRILWASVPFNFVVAGLFAFPASPLAQFLGLPMHVPALYRVLLALFVALFGGAYAWLPRQKIINRPMVALAAIGKAAVFVAVILLWLTGKASGRSAATSVIDAIFAGLFFRWLRL